MYLQSEKGSYLREHEAGMYQVIDIIYMYMFYNMPRLLSIIRFQHNSYSHTRIYPLHTNQGEPPTKSISQGQIFSKVM